MSHIAYVCGCNPPHGKDQGKLVFLRINGNPVAGPEPFVNGQINKPIQTAVDLNGVCTVLVRIEYWIEADKKPNTYHPRRYTQKVTLEMENNTNEEVKIRVGRDSNTLTQAYDIGPGASKLLWTVLEIEPEKQVYDFHIAA